MRRLVGVVTHESFLYRDLTAYENLDFYCRMYDVPRARERIYEVASIVAIKDRLKERVASLSRGMQQRLTLARCLLHRPQILLLDEPTSGLDPEIIEAIWQALRGEEGIKRTIIFTTHDPEVGLEFGERILVLKEGLLIYDKVKAELDRDFLKRIYGKR